MAVPISGSLPAKKWSTPSTITNFLGSAMSRNERLEICERTELVVPSLDQQLRLRACEQNS